MKGFSSKTEVNNVFKLAELARSLSLTKEEKEEFKQVENITLTHALNTETTGLKVSGNVELIYIFQITLKTNNIPLKFLRALDRKTKAHTLFEACYNDSYYYIIANKKIDVTISTGDYYTCDQTHELNFAQQNIENLEDIYTNLLAFVLKLTKRESETPSQIIDRKKRIMRLEKEIEKLERMMNAEKQPNIKMALNDKIKLLKKDIKGEL